MMLNEDTYPDLFICIHTANIGIWALNALHSYGYNTTERRAKLREGQRLSSPFAMLFLEPE